MTELEALKMNILILVDSIERKKFGTHISQKDIRFIQNIKDELKTLAGLEKMKNV